MNRIHKRTPSLNGRSWITWRVCLSFSEHSLPPPTHHTHTVPTNEKKRWSIRWFYPHVAFVLRPLYKCHPFCCVDEHSRADSYNWISCGTQPRLFKRKKFTSSYSQKICLHGDDTSDDFKKWTGISCLIFGLLHTVHIIEARVQNKRILSGVDMDPRKKQLYKRARLGVLTWTALSHIEMCVASQSS